MKWAGMVNNLRSAAEEVVLREIVDRVRTDKANQKIRGKIRGFFNLRTANDFYKMISGKHQKQFMSKQGGNCKIRMNAIAVFSCIMLGEMPLKPLKIAVAIKKLSYCNHTVIKFGGDKCMDFFIRGNVQIKN